jgi:AraC-like DNA-binding protein
MNIINTEKQIKGQHLYYSATTYDYPEFCEVSFPNIGFVFSTFLSCDNFQHKFTMLNLGVRTLNGYFLAKVDLPKAYAKIWQWQHVTHLLQTEPRLSLEDLAIKAGYYDVAHLVRDFKTKLPQTPMQFQQELNPLIQDYLKFT